MFDILKTQRELAAIYAPSGYEGRLANHITQLAKPYADECRADALGNLIIRKRGPGKRVMLSAHMDSVALAATHIDDNGFVRFCEVGVVADIRFCAVEFGGGAAGVVGEKSDMYIDIGASSREEAQKIVNVGDMAVFKSETYTAGGGRLVSPYLDGRIGCAMLLQALSTIQEPVNDLYFVFTVQQELGSRGAKTAAFSVEPDIALAVGVTSADDMPGDARKPGTPQKLGAGASVTLRDKSVIAHPDVVRWLEAAASANKIPVQRDISASGVTDAGEIHLSHGGVPSGAVGVPVRYRHTPAEMADMADIEACSRLIYAAANTKL